MSNKKRTGGRWICEADIYTPFMYQLIAKNDKGQTLVPQTTEEAEANAELIADAGTTANKCGLLPSELLAQRDELLEAAQWAVKQFKRLADEGRYPEFMLSQNGGEGIMPLVNAIKKATE